MDKVDMRKLMPKAAYEFKKQVILHKEARLTDLTVEKLTGVGRPSVNRIWNAFQKDGLKGLNRK